MTFQIEFSSGASNAGIVEHEVQQSEDDSMWRTVFLHATSTVVRLELKPGIRYRWRARSRNGMGVSEWSNILHGPQLPGAPAWISAKFV